MSLADAYTAAAAQIRSRVVDRIVGMFGPDAIGDAGAAEFARRATPAVVAGMRQTASLTDAYLTRQLAQDFGERIVSDKPIDVSQGLRGVPMTEVYARPTNTVRYALSQGKTVTDAVDEGNERLIKMVQSDLQIAKTNQSRATLRRSTVDGFVRVLEGERSCIKCILASTRFYYKEDLLPIHPGCDCGVEAAQKPKDRNVVYDDERLKEVKALIRENGIDPDDFSKVLVVHEHGELGPLLTLKGEAWRPDPETQGSSEPIALDAEVARRMLPGLEKSLKNLRAKGLPEDSPQIQYHLEQIAELRADIAAEELLKRLPS